MGNELSRAEHLQWCKDRAIKEMEFTGRPESALASMTSDTSKHPETEGHAGNDLGMMLLMSGNLSTRDAMKKHIEGYN